MTCNKYVLIFTFFVLSCKTNNHHPYTLFQTQKNLIAEKTALNFVTYNPVQLEIVDSVLMVVDYYATGRNLIRAYNFLDNRVLPSFCRKGLDSNEMLPPITCSGDPIKKQLSVSSRRNYKYAEYPIKDIKDGTTLHTSLTTVNTGISMNLLKFDSLFVSNGYYDDKRLAVYTSQGKQINKYVSYSDVSGDLNNEEHFLAYQGKMIKNPGNKCIVLASTFCDNITFLSYTSGKITQLKYFQDQSPDFRYLKSGDRNIYRTTGKNLRGFIDIKGTKNHVFGLYSGDPISRFPKDKNTVSNTIFVYSWDGKPDCTLNLDKEIAYFAIDEDERFLIAIAFEPTPVFYKFSLKDKL